MPGYAPTPEEIQKLAALGKIPQGMAPQQPQPGTQKDDLDGIVGQLMVNGQQNSAQQKAAMLAQQARDAAAAGKSLFSNPVVNGLAGFKFQGLQRQPKQAQPQVQELAPAQAQKPRGQGKKAKADPRQSIVMSLMGRVTTPRQLTENGLARLGDGMLPAHVFRPEVRKFLEENADGLAGMDPSNLSKDEETELRSWLDPVEYQRWMESRNG